MSVPLLKSADWSLLLDLYFFLAGLAGGSFVIATLARLAGGAELRDVVKVGYILAFLAVIPAPLLLMADLGVPGAFFHLFFVAKPTTAIGASAITLGPVHIKWLSPMNVGAWALAGFGLCSLLALFSVFGPGARGHRSPTAFQKTVGLSGGVLGFVLAAHPGVLLGATARPLFQSGRFLGALFLAVGVTSGAAGIALVITLLRRADIVRSLGRLRRFTVLALFLQAITLLLFLLAVGTSEAEGTAQSLAVLLRGSYSAIFWIGAVAAGLILPFFLHVTARPELTRRRAAISALLILVGGFLLKYAITAAGQTLL